MFTPNILWHNVAFAIKKLHVQRVRPLHNCPDVIVTDIYHFQVSHVRVTEHMITHGGVDILTQIMRLTRDVSLFTDLY